MYSQNDNSYFKNKVIMFKKTFLKTISVLPYYEYKPSINPSETTINLLTEISVCEKIVDDHIQFKLTNRKNRRMERGKGAIKYFRLIKLKERHDPIEDKISDINYIRGLTARYETWSPRWEKKADIAKTELSLDEIDLIEYEGKRISKKLKYSVFKLL